jgi:serine/threonine protein kinase
MKLGHPHTLKFESYNQSLSLKNSNIPSELLEWRNLLGKKVNQRGFHELFKPIKKVGKGNFASVYLVIKYEDGKKYAVKAFSKEGTYSEEKGK